MKESGAFHFNVRAKKDFIYEYLMVNFNVLMLASWCLIQ